MTNEPTTGELIEQLHTFDNVDTVTITIAKAALLFIADRLESQEQTIDELEDECGKLKMTINLLTARAEQAERERDAAIAEFEEYMLGNEDIPCKYCANHSTDKKCFPYTKSCEPKYNKWRGLPQEGEGERCRVKF